MKEISGSIKSVIISNENEILCKVVLDNSLYPYFNTLDLLADIKSIGDITNKKEISKNIYSLIDSHFSGIFLRPTGNNQIEIHII